MSIRVNLNTHFARQVIEAAAAGCIDLQAGQNCDVEHICGPDLWDALTASEHKQAGKVISAAVQEGLLPLVKSGLTSEFHQLYTPI
jgi:hypothetical protein